MSDCRHVLTILAVEELGESVGFYDGAFAWKKVVEAPAYVEYRLPGGQRLGLYQRDGFAHNTGQLPEKIPRRGLAPTELYFHTEELEAEVDRVEAAGGRLLSPVGLRDWGDDAAYFADPSGNVIVLARPRAE